MPTVRAIARTVEKHDNSFSSIVLEIVRSEQFQKRVKTAERTAATN
jgi:hypothetical protein